MDASLVIAMENDFTALLSKWRCSLSCSCWCISGSRMGVSLRLTRYATYLADLGRILNQSPHIFECLEMGMFSCWPLSPRKGACEKIKYREGESLAGAICVDE